jgi:hypothetical protein
LKEVEALESVTFRRDDAGTEREVRIGGIGLQAGPGGDERSVRRLREPTEVPTGERKLGDLTRLRRAIGDAASIGTPVLPTAGPVRRLAGWEQAVMGGTAHGLADQLQKRARDALAWLRLIHSPYSLGVAAGEVLARARATFSDDAPMRVRIATGARLLGLRHG